MKKRSIGLAILFTILTCGIYMIYMQCSIQGGIKEKTGLGFGAVGHFFMCFVPFYALYWMFKMGERVEKAGGPNNGILYLILGLISASTITTLIIQNDINHILAKNAAAA